MAREKEVQIAGIKQEDEQMTTVARNILRQELFEHHPYALRANGSVDSVQQLTQKDLLAFRDRYLVAKNGVIAVLADVRAAEVKRAFRKESASMKPGALALTVRRRAGAAEKSETVESQRTKAQGVRDGRLSRSGYVQPGPISAGVDRRGEQRSRFALFYPDSRRKWAWLTIVGASQMEGLVPGLFAFYLGTDPKKDRAGESGAAR